MPSEDSLCLRRLMRPSLVRLCWLETLQICTTTSQSSLAVRLLSLGPGSSLQVDAISCPSCMKNKTHKEMSWWNNSRKNTSVPTRQLGKWVNINIPLFKIIILGNEAQECLWWECRYLYIRVVVDQWLRHLQRQILVLPPVEHEHNTFLPNNLTQWKICGREKHCTELQHPTLKYEFHFIWFY